MWTREEGSKNPKILCMSLMEAPLCCWWRSSLSSWEWAELRRGLFVSELSSHSSASGCQKPHAHGTGRHVSLINRYGQSRHGLNPIPTYQLVGPINSSGLPFEPSSKYTCHWAGAISAAVNSNHPLPRLVLCISSQADIEKRLISLGD